MTGFRMDQINELIRQQLGEILLRELSLKNGILITISKVDTTKDLRYTRVSLSIYPEKETGYVIETLRKEMFEIQGKLNRKLSVHPLPRIIFQADRTEIEADEVEKLLEHIQRERGKKD